jgi:hypothetical protein
MGYPGFLNFFAQDFFAGSGVIDTQVRREICLLHTVITIVFRLATEYGTPSKYTYDFKNPSLFPVNCRS